MRAWLTGLVVVASFVACNDRPVAPIDDENDAGTDEDAGSFPTPQVELGRHSVRISATRRIVPSPAPAAPVLNSNNNLDVAKHEGRFFLAYRTAPDHYASDKVRMVVVSSADENTWTFERDFFVGEDLREPRLLVVGSELFLYISRLGSNPGKFEPRGVLYTKRTAGGTWTDLAPVMREATGDAGAASPMTGYIAWRTRIERGTPYMTAYLGGEHIYQFDGIPLDVDLLTTTDGVTWRGARVSRGGGSETDFALADDGSLRGIIRNEAGDETGWGSKVCSAPANDLFTWTCVPDKKKYDSPYVFAYDGEVYLVGRRNVSETGFFDIGKRDVTPAGTLLAFQIDYLQHQKRCALWRFVPGEQRIAYILDLPSKGDTCFPARMESPNPGEVVIYNYSSDVDGPDVSWRAGQAGATFVYRHTLVFTPR